MKKEILKIAGVKTEKQFYSKYPTEEAFMKKHGKEFQAKCGGMYKKAQMGSDVASLDMEDLYDINESSGVQFTREGANKLFQKIPPLQAIDTQNLNLGKYKGMGYFDINQQNDEFVVQPTIKNPHNPDSYKSVMKYLQGLNPNAKFARNTYVAPPERGMKYGGKVNYAHEGREVLTPMGNTMQTQGFSKSVTSGLGDVTTNLPVDFNQSASFGDYAGAYGQDALNLIGGVAGGISELKGEKDRLRQLKQQRMVSDVMLDASRTIEELPERRYVRPEDIQNTGEEFFPIYGVGTNALAKYGTNVPKGYHIMPDGSLMKNDEMYETGGTLRLRKAKPKSDEQLKKEELEMIRKEREKKTKTKQGFEGIDVLGDVTNKFVGAGFGNNAGYQIGNSIGGALSVVPGVGPIAGALAGPVFGTIGGLLDRNPNNIKKEERKIKRNINGLIGNEFARSIPSQYGNVMKGGGNISSMDGDLQVYEGNARTMSYNPFLPDGGETVMFNGPSHAEGGMPISYGGSPVEVEGGEPAMKLENGTSGEENLTVFGNLKIPNEFTVIDPKAKGKKFKNYINDLSKVENKNNKILDKSMEELSSLDPVTSFDKLKLSSLKANTMGATMKLKDIAEKKTKAASLQNAINQTAEEFNIDADSLSRGNIKKAKKGTYINKAQDGTTISPDEIKGYIQKYFPQEEWDNAYKIMMAESGGDPLATGMNKDSLDLGLFQINTKWHPEVFKSGSAHSDPEENVRAAAEIWKKRGWNEWSSAKKALGSDFPGADTSSNVSSDSQSSPISNLIGNNLTSTKQQTVPETTKSAAPTEPVPYNRSLLMDIANEVLPYLTPSDKEALNANQLLGEQYAMATNQLEPVQAQTYKPQLDVPYDISLQDIRNENQADYRAGQRMAGYNPAFQSSLNAQKYAANQKVGAEEFRLNQAKKDQVYSQNRATMNDAQLKNLAIYDTQYTRQAQAKSNTKATAQAALNSISDKYAKNQLENRTLQTYENLYNYRFGNDFRAQNWNGFYQPTIPQVGSVEGQTQVPVYDSEGNIVRYQLQSKPSMATPGFNPNAKNGGLVKMLKTI